MPIENFSSYQSPDSPEKSTSSRNKNSHEKKVDDVSHAVFKKSILQDHGKTLEGKEISHSHCVRNEVEAINDTVFFLSQNLDKKKYPRQVEVLEALSENETELLPGVSIREIGEKYHEVRKQISEILKEMQYADIIELMNIEPPDFLLRELHLAIPSLESESDTSRGSDFSSLLSSVGRVSSQESLDLQAGQLVELVDDFLVAEATSEAWEVACSIPQEPLMETGMAKVCRHLINNNSLDEAAQYIDAMDESLVRDELLSETAIAYMQNILVQESTETAFKITDETRKSRTLSTLSLDLASLSKGYDQIDEAVKLANTIKDLQVRQETFGKLAIHSARNREIPTAMALIEQISSDEIKTAVLVKLCTEDVRSLPKELLLQFAAMIPDPISRKSTQAKIEQISPRKTT